MRLPWHRRVDMERRRREVAEIRRDQARAQWPDVHRAIEPLRRERALNGWTDHIVSIFHPPRRGHL